MENDFSWVHPFTGFLTSKACHKFSSLFPFNPTRRPGEHHKFSTQISLTKIFTRSRFLKVRLVAWGFLGFSLSYNLYMGFVFLVFLSIETTHIHCKDFLISLYFVILLTSLDNKLLFWLIFQVVISSWFMYIYRPDIFVVVSCVEN